MCAGKEAVASVEEEEESSLELIEGALLPDFGLHPLLSIYGQDILNNPANFAAKSEVDVLIVSGPDAKICESGVFNLINGSIHSDIQKLSKRAKAMKMCWKLSRLAYRHSI